jgi:flagellar hook assembly protein FlgD
MLWPAPAEVEAYNLSGRRIRQVSRGHYFEGEYLLVWDGLDDRGLRVPSGTYVCSAEAGDARASTRVVLIR